MDEEGEQNVIHQRNDGEGERNFRNVRRNMGLDRVEPFSRRILMSIPNISVMRSQTRSIPRRSYLNPNSILLSLQHLVLNGSQHRTLSVFLILSISLASSGHTQIQQIYNGS
jgi:hypothetical protein